jgi:hypothetical protein
LHEIASVMIRYGWGDLVRVPGISGALERAGRALHWRSTSEISQIDAPVRIRRALEELGPTFVKLGQLLARGRKSMREALDVVADLPRDLQNLVRDMRRVRVDLDLKRLDHFGHQLDRASNQLTMGILTASLVAGSSIIMTVESGPQLFGLPLFGLLGFRSRFSTACGSSFPSGARASTESSQLVGLEVNRLAACRT